MKLALSLLPVELAVARLPVGSPMPDWLDWSDPFVSVTRAPDHVSIVCEARRVPPDVTAEAGWRPFQVAGPIDMSLSGVLFRILMPLAEAGVPILAISTYDTDYILVRDARVGDAATALRSVAEVDR